MNFFFEKIFKNLNTYQRINQTLKFVDDYNGSSIGRLYATNLPDTKITQEHFKGRKGQKRWVAGFALSGIVCGLAIIILGVMFTYYIPSNLKTDTNLRSHKEIWSIFLFIIIRYSHDVGQFLKFSKIKTVFFLPKFE